MSTPLADDFAAIKEALERLEADKKPAEAPKAWPDFTPVESVYDGSVAGGEVWGHYSAPAADCALLPSLSLVEWWELEADNAR